MPDELTSSELQSKAPLLRDEFAGHSYTQWRTAAEKLLKGAPFDKKLKTPLDEGFTLEPLYRKDDIRDLPHLGQLPGQGSQVRGRTATGNLVSSWVVSQELVVGDVDEFNEAVRDDLARGQTELTIVLDAIARSGRDGDAEDSDRVDGLRLSTLGELDRALADIDLSRTPIFLRAGAACLPASALLLAYAKKTNVPLEGCLGCDPLGELAATGQLCGTLDTALDQLVALTQWTLQHAPAVQTICASGAPYADAGAHAVQELGYTLATIVAYLEKLTDAGVSIEDASPRMRLSLALGANVFVEIAKLRAARHLYSKIAEAFGARTDRAKAIHLDARSTHYNKTLFDPHVNLLRGTTEAFAGVVGGADSLHVAPYDAVVRPANEFSRRCARNTQLVLADEHDLRQVIDPAGGSYYVEWLTDKIARAAWDLLQKTQREGGMASLLKNGVAKKAVAETARVRRSALGRRQRLLVGTNVYPNAQEAPLEAASPSPRDALREALDAWRAQRDDSAVESQLAKVSAARGPAQIEAAIAATRVGATLGELSRAVAGAGPAAAVEPLELRRLAEDFEKLRLDVMAAGDGKKGPLVFQANIGPSRLYRARADWTAGFFQVAGFDVASTRDFEDEKQALDAAVQAKARLIVITSTDETYRSVVPTLAKALHEALSGCHVMVAGAPADDAQKAAWTDAGVNELINARVDALATLQGLLGRIGA